MVSQVSGQRFVEKIYAVTIIFVYETTPHLNSRVNPNTYRKLCTKKAIDDGMIKEYVRRNVALLRTPYFC